jgi:hypothetical protein
VNWRSPVRWAAVLTFGVFAGFVAGRWPAANRIERVGLITLAKQPTAVTRVVDLKEKYAGTFWGQKVLASLQPRSHPGREDRQQSSDLWDMYRQYVKDKRHE